MPRAPAIAFLLALLFDASAGAATRDRSGSYSSVQYVADADDYVGARLTVRRGVTTEVEFELCEGWCYGAETLPATISGDRISFVYPRRWTSAGGAETVEHVPITGRFQRGALVLKIGDEPPERLKRLRPKP